MELKVEIQQAVKAAMKSGDTVTLSTLRLLLAALQNEEIRLRRALSADEIQKIIGTLCKQRGEAIELYRKGGREELAAREEAELAILKGFLPQQLTDEEIKQLTKIFRAGTIERYAGGRVQLVKPQVVLEVAFDGMQKSPRHKSGYALRFPRIIRWRQDKTPADIDTLARVQELFQKA